MMNFDALTKENNQNDEENVITFEDKVEEYKTFSTLQTIITMILKSEELGINNFSDLYQVLVEDLDEEENEKLIHLLYKFLEYVKVPSGIIEDLFNDDEEISQAEFENLAELIIDRIGEHSIDEFIAYALNNPDLVDIDVETDDLQYDWAFYHTEAECEKGTGNRKVPKSAKQQCVLGVKNKEIGFWRYPEGNFPNGDYQLKNGGKRNPTNLNAGAKAKFNAKRHIKKADTVRKADNKVRAKLKLKTFSGYLGKAKKTSAKKKDKQEGMAI